jgi:hypothetical protein
MSETFFAHGTNSVGVHGCPVVTAEGEFGELRDGPMGFYDEEVFKEVGVSCGVVDEETARRCWFKAMVRTYLHYKEFGRDRSLKKIDEGVETAERLGWI